MSTITRSSGFARQGRVGLRSSPAVSLLLLVAAIVPGLAGCDGATPTAGDDAAVARGLVARNSWGVVSTTSASFNGTAFGNLLSFSDGPEQAHSGTPYFYLSPLDPTLMDLRINPSCTFTVSLIGTKDGCTIDPQDPNCAKLTIFGKMKAATGEHLERAREALFSRHPDMRLWPAGHQFEFHYLDIDWLFVLDHYGGARHLTAQEYYSAQAPSTAVFSAFE